MTTPAYYGDFEEYYGEPETSLPSEYVGDFDVIDSNNGGVTDPSDPNYSNEGRNYPTPESTQGSGGSPVNSSIPNSAITDAFNKLFGSSFTGKQLAGLFGVAGGGIAGLLGANKPSVVKGTMGYQGKIPQYTATRNMVTAPPTSVNGKPYRPGQGGVNYGGDVTYTPKPATAAKTTPLAQGGIANLAKGRYLQGNTDGMADELRTSIDGDQPAALSHGEFVIPADVVSHLGNGNSDAGAKKLYSMMDKIRQARTGTKKQGKQINPDKFMPGGLAAAYAGGGSVQRFQTGGVPSNTLGTEQTLASWTGDYVPNMLAKGQALAEAPYQQYGGPLTAGPSALQTQAFGAAGNLAVPASVGTAADTAGGIAAKAQNMNYSPTQATNQFTAPEAYQAAGTPQYNQLNAGNVSSSFQAPAAYQTGNFNNQFTAPTQSAATNFTNQYQAPTPYQNTNFTSGTFGNEQAQQYMNPYLQQSLNPQLAEARRQSDITAQQNNAKMTQAGAFGGGRQALLTAENQRNLGTRLSDITGQGYNTAFTNAMSQYNADQGRGLQAQQATEASKQFGANQSMTAAQMQAQYGMSAQQAQEAARQFNQQQAMTGAQSAAQYGLAGQQATEASRQFGSNLGLQSATTAGSQGLQAALANQQAGLTSGQSNINAALEAARQQEQSRQFGAGQGMTAAQNAAQYGQAAQQANIGQQQFGANLGLQGLQLANQAAQTQGNLGISSGQLGLANLNAQANLGAQERGIESEGIAADQAAFSAARDNPYKMLQFQQSLLNGLPISAQNYQTTGTSGLTDVAGGMTTVDAALKALGLSPGQTGAVTK